MTPARPRFDPKAIAAAAGPQAHGRGEAYMRDGRVTLIGLAPERVDATVEGGEDYRVRLTGRGRAVDGDCTCPAFADGGFCKHMVAAALAANAAEKDATAAAPPPNPLARVRAHLVRLPAETLVALVLDAAARDAALLRKLDLAAVVADGDPVALESRMRAAVDAATRTRGFLDYRAARDWAAGVEEALDALAAHAVGPHAAAVLRLAEYALARIEASAHDLDDSDGRCAGLLERARDIHLAACRAAPPAPAPLARALFARETASHFDTFTGAARIYADVLGNAGRAEYRRLAAEAWAALPARVAGDAHHARFALFAILDGFASADGDLDGRIALRAKDLATPRDVVALARFCRDHGRPDAALRHVEDGLWRFADGCPDTPLVLLAADLLAAAGRRADAEAALMRAFRGVPSLDLYRALRDIAPDAVAGAIAEVEVRAASQPCGDLLVQLLLEEGRRDAAWRATRAHTVALNLRLALAAATEATHPAEALSAYAERVEALAQAGGAACYAEAAAIVARMASLRPRAAQAAYVAALKVRHARKRTFLGRLP